MHCFYDRHLSSVQVLALAAGGNLDLLVDQIHKFQPELVSIRDPTKVQC